jgi:DNA polymerase
MTWYADDTPMPLLSGAVRSVITAENGKKIIASDLAAIEGRSLAWLAGEEWKLKAYRDFDNKSGSDLYVLAYANAFGVDPSEIDGKERQLGKVLELALGYGGGVGAFITFSLINNVNLDELAEEMYDRLPKWAVNGAVEWWEVSRERGETYKLDKKVFVTCDAIKRMWRSKNPSIVQFWYDLENAAKNVILNSDGAVRVRSVFFDKKGVWMRIRLPSGRYLSYPGARIVSNKIRYLGLNMYSRKWCSLSTYGGKLAENITQAFACDVFYYGLVRAEKQGYATILPVHDEGVTETEKGSGKTIEELNEILSVSPTWAPGLPLSAKGFEGKRYRKE